MYFWLKKENENWTCKWWVDDLVHLIKGVLLKKCKDDTIPNM